jgi:ferredoxin-NADP reductase
MNMLVRLLGLLICGLVALQLGAFLIRSISKLFGESELRKLRIQKLRDEIDALCAQREKQQQEVAGWNGYRKFRLAKKKPECVGCHSFYLVPHDGKPLPSFLPGQYLTFELKIPGEKKPVIRCYSLSSKYDERYYRCTIKKMLPPHSAPEAAPGISSSYFNDVLNEGDILDVKAPRGNFFLHQDRETPVVLLAGGVGITPMMTMAETLLAHGSARPIHLFFGVPNGSLHIFKQDLEQMAAQFPTLHLTVCYSDPLPSDRIHHDFQVEGRVSVPLLRASLPSTNCDFYLCGPGAMMVSLTEGLSEWGVEESRIHTEAFGPSSVKKNKKPALVAAGVGAEGPPNPPPSSPVGSTALVSFDRSGAQVPWNDNFDSLLEFAEANGVEIESGCRAGNCGTCLTAVKSGKVKYAEEAGASCEDGTCLPCICTPDGSLSIDA